MKRRLAWWTMAAVCVQAGQALSQMTVTMEGPGPAATQASKPAEDLGQYTEMPGICKLSEEQLAKLKEKVAANRDASAAFWKENQAKVEQLGRDISQAAKAKDTEKAKKLQEELNDIYNKSRKLYSENQVQILAVLSPEQRLAWDSYNLRKFLNFRYSRITFSPEQEQKVQQLCNEGAKEIGKIKDPTDLGAEAEIRGGVAQKIDELLTPEQKENLPRWPTTVRWTPATKPVEKPVEKTE